MHQPDQAADITARKMSHPADLPRRGSGTSSLMNVSAGPGVAGHVLSADDYPSSILMQPPPPPPAAASSPGPQQHPPQTLNLMPQTLGQSGAQIKKKSGFQITSVTPAQISASMSSNNSIAEDTESYDDLDESHTEDLSSSEILDVSLSRATDLGGPERSSSEETLNNFQEAETPGAVSPNQPHLPQHHLPPHVQQNIIINGNVHHHHHLHHHPGSHNPHPGISGSSLPVAAVVNAAAVKLATAGSSDSTGITAPAPSVAQLAGSIPPVVRKTSGPVSSGVSPSTGNSVTTNANISGMSGVTSAVPSGNLNTSSITSTGNASVVSGNINTNIQSSFGNGGSTVSSGTISNVSGATAAGPAVGQQQQPAPSAVTSRFRVVKLDSSTEPFKKGRWTCMEFYDKENLAAASDVAVINKAVESVKQNPLEVTSERESTSGSSVSSNISTLSHYTESVGSGEMGVPAIQQQGFQGLGPPHMDFSSTVTQNVPAPNLPQSISQPQLAQLQIHSQDPTYSPQKQAVPSAQATLNASTGVQTGQVNMLSVPSSLGHQQLTLTNMIPQQLPYTQQTQPIQSLPAVPQQQLQYAHQQAAPTQMTSGHVMPVNQTPVPGNLPEYLQHPQLLQTAMTPVQASSTGAGNPATVPVQAQVMQAQIQSTTTQAPPSMAPIQPVAQATLPAAGSQALGVAQQGNLPTAVHQATVSQASSSILQQSIPAPSPQVLPAPQGIHVGAPGLPHQVIIAPQNPLLPTKPPAQVIEPAVQGMASQQVPAVSPLLTATNIPTIQQLSTSTPPGISSATTNLGLPPAVSQPSAAPNSNLVQSGNQVPAVASMPVAQNMPFQMTSVGHFLAPSLIQSVANQIVDARRLMEQSVAGLPHISEGTAVDTTGGLGGGSFLPLKSLPLSTAPLVDGEDERI
ncbi:TSC22 domain family protein 1 isoform X2 [Bombina bombina]|uniref:TSC22 domain family protein 1 isoform X2 n=2 Tax=Bombina bombina TaxID=8345 RepID=UPI00235AB596|nr:TSC22 domain family protein 1 isoform X2 [Bombina bombina]